MDRHSRFTHIEKVASRALLAVVTLVIILMLLPVQVLSNWRLSTNTDKYHVSDRVYLTSEYTKNYDLKGQSSRSLVCDTANGQASYPIFYAFAGTGVGHQKTISTVTVPEIEQRLPVRCNIRVDILYTVAGVKPVSHTQTSNDFWIIPGPDVPKKGD